MTELLKDLEKLYGWKINKSDVWGRRPALPVEVQRVVEQPQQVPPQRTPESQKHHITRDGKK
jgi:hypothetical protein